MLKAQSSEILHLWRLMVTYLFVIFQQNNLALVIRIHINTQQNPKVHFSGQHSELPSCRPGFKTFKLPLIFHLSLLISLISLLFKISHPSPNTQKLCTPSVGVMCKFQILSLTSIVNQLNNHTLFLVKILQRRDKNVN